MKRELRISYKCRFCGEPIDKDTAALNKKLINRNQPPEAMVCLQCMTDTLDCSVDDLREQDGIYVFPEQIADEKTRRELVNTAEEWIATFGCFSLNALYQRFQLKLKNLSDVLIDFEMPCIFPILAFGLSRDSFIRIVNGLATNYLSFITGSFTHGLDEVRLYPENKTTDDVIELIL